MMALPLLTLVVGSLASNDDGASCPSSHSPEGHQSAPDKKHEFSALLQHSRLGQGGAVAVETAADGNKSRQSCAEGTFIYGPCKCGDMVCVEGQYCLAPSYGATPACAVLDFKDGVTYTCQNPRSQAYLVPGSDNQNSDVSMYTGPQVGLNIMFQRGINGPTYQLKSTNTQSLVCSCGGPVCARNYPPFSATPCMWYVKVVYNVYGAGNHAFTFDNVNSQGTYINQCYGPGQPDAACMGVEGSDFITWRIEPSPVQFVTTTTTTTMLSYEQFVGDCFGDNIKVYDLQNLGKVASVHECKQACDNNPACEGFSFATWTSQCITKKGICTEVVQDGWIFYKKL